MQWALEIVHREHSTIAEWSRFKDPRSIRNTRRISPVAGKTDPTGRVLTRQAWEPRCVPWHPCGKLGRQSCICNPSPGETDRKIPGTHWSDSLAELVSPWSHWETWSQKKRMVFLRMITKIIPWPLWAHVCATMAHMPVNTHSFNHRRQSHHIYIHIQRCGDTCLGVISGK